MSDDFTFSPTISKGLLDLVLQHVRDLEERVKDLEARMSYAEGFAREGIKREDQQDV